MRKLKILRIKQKLSQKDIAVKMHTSVATISRWESGKFFPCTAKLPQLARIFNCTIDELLDSGEYNAD